jgi:hypothetical protein
VRTNEVHGAASQLRESCGQHTESELHTSSSFAPA